MQDAQAPLFVDPADKPVEAGSISVERGQVYEVGFSRLMCGDSTCEADVDRLLGGSKPRLLITDPPYGTDYAPEWRDEKMLFAAGRKGIARNTEGFDDSAAGTAGALDLVPFAEVAYVWSASLTVDESMRELREAGYVLRSMIVWRKHFWAVSRGYYHWQHELCLYGVRKGKAAGWRGDRRQSSVWDIESLQKMNLTHHQDDQLDKRTGHATQKPVECMERPMRNHLGIVYDPFCGSGTTLVAAERQKKMAYGMEIDPAHVSAALARLERIFKVRAKRA